MDDEERDRILVAALRGEADKPLRWWWISFCDADRPKGQQFLGAAMVQARGPASALREAHLRKCNPGGEAQTVEGPAGVTIPEEWANRLLTRAEVDSDELDRIIRGVA